MNNYFSKDTIIIMTDKSFSHLPNTWSVEIIQKVVWCHICVTRITFEIRIIFWKVIINLHLSRTICFYLYIFLKINLRVLRMHIYLMLYPIIICTPVFLTSYQQIWHHWNSNNIYFYACLSVHIECYAVMDQNWCIFLNFQVGLYRTIFHTYS